MSRTFLFILCLVAGAAIAAQETTAPPAAEVIVSVADQRLALLYDGGLVEKYRVSTSKFGVGDSFYSYKTPPGKLRVCEKIGDALDPGTVIRNRTATGEVLQVNAPGRDPIVTRILWLEGLEDQNRNAKSRGIYIHGTPEERTLGEPKSWGCIRMRSNDVVKLFDQVPVGTQVTIISGHLPHLEKYHPPEPLLIAANTPPAAPARMENPSRSAAPPPLPVPREKRTASHAAVSMAPAATLASAAHAPAGTDNQTVSHALKGSILMAGLPNAPTFGSGSHVAAAQSTAAASSSGEKNTPKQ